MWQTPSFSFVVYTHYEISPVSKSIFQLTSNLPFQRCTSASWLWVPRRVLSGDSGHRRCCAHDQLQGEEYDALVLAGERSLCGEAPSKRHNVNKFPEEKRGEGSVLPFIRAMGIFSVLSLFLFSEIGREKKIECYLLLLCRISLGKWMGCILMVGCFFGK